MHSSLACCRKSRKIGRHLAHRMSKGRLIRAVIRQDIPVYLEIVLQEDPCCLLLLKMEQALSTLFLLNFS